MSTGRGRLPADALSYYISLGAVRSYLAVANRFGVSKRAVSKRAAAEEWQVKLKAMTDEARTKADEQTATELEGLHLRHVSRLGDYQDAIREVISPERLRAMVATLVRLVVQKDDVSAARLLFERLMGRPRTEPLPAVSLDLPDGLETASDVRTAANALLQSIADGSIAPEDARLAAAVIEAARKSVETDELERRITELEQRYEARTER